jgi:glycerol-3-phosphate cytidylyltransferase-like family protein
MIEGNEQSYDYVCFGDLAYEFDFSDLKEAEKKIKRKLKYYRLEKYDQERIDYVRELKNDLFKEISLQTKSKYFNQSRSNYADFTDFDYEKMKKDYLKKFEKISDSDMSRILNFAIYLYHMR